jgi:hypothetical protein
MKKYQDMACDFFAENPNLTFDTKRQAAEYIADKRPETFSDSQIRRLATAIGVVLTTLGRDVQNASKVSSTVKQLGEKVDEIKSNAPESNSVYAIKTLDGDGQLMAVSVTLSDGSSFTARDSDRYFNALVEAVDANDYTAVENIINPAKIVAKFTASFGEIKIVHGQIKFNETVLKGALVDNILDRIGQGKSIQALVKALRKLEANPDPHVRERLFDYIVENKLGFTPDGDILFYKQVEHDYSSWYKYGRNPAQVTSVNDPSLVIEIESGPITYCVGTVVTQDRKFVDSNPLNGCSYGLHVGGYGYHTWSGHRTLVASVDPRDVVALPYNNDHAIRVCKMTIEGEISGSYRDAMSDIVYENYRDDIQLDQSRTEKLWDTATETIVDEASDTTVPAAIDPKEGGVHIHPFAKFVDEVMKSDNPLIRFLSKTIEDNKG